MDAETTTETAGLNAAEPAETGESAETEAPREVRAKAIEEAMKMARLLRKFSEEHWEPEVHEVVAGFERDQGFGRSTGGFKRWRNDQREIGRL